MRNFAQVLRAAALIASLVGGCAIGAPPGFSSGDHWSFPLVGPLENSNLVVPVYVNDTGPYLFMLDPDSEYSSVDAGIQSALKLYSVQGPAIQDENDNLKETVLAETRELRIGDLTVSNKQVRVHHVGMFWFNGRQVRGLIGRDILSDSLILQLDRDRGMVHLGTQGHLAPPPDATTELAMKLRNSRYLVKLRVNDGNELAAHLDLGARWTMLWPTLLERAKLPTVRVSAAIVDEAGTRREITTGSIAAKVAVGGAEASGLLLLPFGDRRTRAVDLDGAVGNNFLAAYHVTVNWHQKKVWLRPRTADVNELVGERLRRWGPQFDTCKAPACLDIRHGDGSFALVREGPAAELAYEVLFEAVDDEGMPLGLPRLRATLPAGAPTISDPDVATAYAEAAGFRILDVSPFPRDCDVIQGGGRRCVWQVPKTM